MSDIAWNSLLPKKLVAWHDTGRENECGTWKVELSFALASISSRNKELAISGKYLH